MKVSSTMWFVLFLYTFLLQAKLDLYKNCFIDAMAKRIVKMVQTNPLLVLQGNVALEPSSARMGTALLQPLSVTELMTVEMALMNRIATCPAPSWNSSVARMAAAF